jgi:glycine oxidase
MRDVLIIGGGVIGLSLAWDLARHGQSVQVIDREQPGREASWAGAGILPAANRSAAIHPYDQLCGLACELHPQWAAELSSLTGIDTGYRRCGGIYLARTRGEAAALAGWAAEEQAKGIAVAGLSASDLERVEPGLAKGSGVFGGTTPSLVRNRLPLKASAPLAFHLPNEAQLRNPRHLQALVAACNHAGVEITPGVAAADVVFDVQRAICEITTSAGSLRACRYCFTAGAWTGQLLARLDVPLEVLPMRGQMVMFRCPRPPIQHILNEGSRYLVPRDDGRVLAGSTEEEVGFDKRTTAEGIAELTAFARDLVPALADAPIERAWAGLRPASFDGFPYLGPLPGGANGYVAAGHFRSGLYLSPATAVVMSELLRGEQPQIDLKPFRVGR